MISPDLMQCRREIDAIDEALIALLAKRFRVVDRVVLVKQRDGIPAALPDRIDDVISRARQLADTADIPPDSAEALWRLLIAETISYERARRVK